MMVEWLGTVVWGEGKENFMLQPSIQRRQNLAKQRHARCLFRPVLLLISAMLISVGCSSTNSVQSSAVEQATPDRP